jgi:3-methyl-2-oxobutanoate hydroxymethyltransferase
LQETNWQRAKSLATTAPAPAKSAATKAVTIRHAERHRARRRKITMLTCYDASFAALMDRCGVEMLLIGDSLGMVCAGPPVDAAGDGGRSGIPHRLGCARHQVGA